MQVIVSCMTEQEMLCEMQHGATYPSTTYVAEQQIDSSRWLDRSRRLLRCSAGSCRRLAEQERQTEAQPCSSPKMWHMIV